MIHEGRNVQIIQGKILPDKSVIPGLSPGIFRSLSSEYTPDKSQVFPVAYLASIL